MFLLARSLNGKKQFLKDSSSFKTKTFPTSLSAQFLCRKLNSQTTLDKQWHVEQGSH